MKAKEIRFGRWYETTLGVGECRGIGRTYPPSVRVYIVAPFPRGTVNLPPRDVLREVKPQLLVR